jgi:hypothetical protein
MSVIEDWSIGRYQGGVRHDIVEGPGGDVGVECEPVVREVEVL